MKDITWLDMYFEAERFVGYARQSESGQGLSCRTVAHQCLFRRIRQAVHHLSGLPVVLQSPSPLGKGGSLGSGCKTNFFRNRHFEGVYYKKTTKDLLAEVPGISGTVPGISNLGSIENKGVELAIDWRDRIGDWGYSAGFNLTTIKNKVLSLVQEGYSIIAGDKSQSYDGRLSHRLLLRLQG